MRGTNSAEIQEMIRQAIGKGELSSGEPLVESVLAAKFGVSRIPVREALRALEQEGLVIHIPGKGRFVAGLSTQDVEEVFLLREVLELTAARLSFKRVPEEEVVRVEAMLNALYPGCSPREDFYRADIETHALLVRYAGNKRLETMLRMLNSQIERARRIAAMLPHRLAKSVEEHKGIVEALKLRDLSLLEERLRTHLRNVKEATLEVCRTRLGR